MGLVAARGVFNVGRIVDFVKPMDGTVDQSQGVALMAAPMVRRRSRCWITRWRSRVI